MLKLLESRREIRRLARDWRSWSEKIARAAEEVLGSCEVYVFGSVVEGKDVGASDVDLLINCEQLPKRNKERGELKAKIEETARLPLYHPFEMHLADVEETKSNPIYRTAIREGIRIK